MRNDHIAQLEIARNSLNMELDKLREESKSRYAGLNQDDLRETIGFLRSIIETVSTISGNRASLAENDPRMMMVGVEAARILLTHHENMTK